jgi:hypothetical protein
VEENFRQLDRELRERIAAWSGSKGALLDDVVGSREAIGDSDQGKSFQAFYDFLLSPARRAELTELLEQAHGLAAIGEPDPRMRHVHYDWLDAGERAQATVRQLSEQLRRFLDDQVWLENRRVVDLLRSIEANALKLRPYWPVNLTIELDGTAPSIVLPLERPLYSPPTKTPIDSASVTPGQDGFDATALFEQVYIDPAQLARTVRLALQQRSQVGLAQLLGEQPLEQGLAELVTYLSLTDETFRVVFDEQVQESVGWRDADGHTRTATLPRVTFARATGGDAPAASTGPNGGRT